MYRQVSALTPIPHIIIEGNSNPCLFRAGQRIPARHMLLSSLYVKAHFIAFILTRVAFAV